MDSGYFVKAIEFGAGLVSWAAELPRVDHVTHHLPFVGITRTSINLDPSILVSGGGGAAQVWDVDLPPIRLVPAWNEAVVILLFGFAQRRQEHSREDGDDRDDDQQLDQRESLAPVLICSNGRKVI